MINYLIKALDDDSAVKSVELEVLQSRKDAIARAKEYAKLYYKNTILVEKYNNVEYIEIIASFKHLKAHTRK